MSSVSDRFINRRRVWRDQSHIDGRNAKALRRPSTQPKLTSRSTLSILQDRLKANNIDAAVFLTSENGEDHNVTYLIGQKMTYALLIVNQKNATMYVSPLEEIPRLEKETKNLLKVKVLRDSREFYEHLKKFKTIGVNFSRVTKASYDRIKKEINKKTNAERNKTIKQKRIKLVDIGKIVSDQRQLKTIPEIKKIKKAVEITERIFRKLFVQLRGKKFTTEYEIFEFLINETKSAGCSVSFEPTVASGKHASLPHYHPKKQSRILSGLCVIDYGVKYQEYCSDMTRTVLFSDKQNMDRYEKEKEKYNKVLASLENTEKRFCTGINIKEFWEEFNKSQLKMAHALGHGIGCEVHEAPILAINNALASDGMVVAVEPAFYQGTIGVRIEDNYLLDGSLKRLGKLPRKMLTFELPTKRKN